MIVHRLNRLLVGMGVGVMMVVMVMGVYNHHNLRLRRKWNCEAAEENSCQKCLFHTPSVSHPTPMC